MATASRPAAKRAPRRRSRNEVALVVLPAIYASAGYEILNQKDGKLAARAVHLSFEVADAYIAFVEKAA